MKAKNVFQWWQRQKWSKYRYLTLKAPILRLTWELILMNLKLPYTWLEFDLFEIELNHVKVHVNPPENEIFLSGNVLLFFCTHKDLSLPKDQAKAKFFELTIYFFFHTLVFLHEQLQRNCSPNKKGGWKEKNKYLLENFGFKCLKATVLKVS